MRSMSIMWRMKRLTRLIKPLKFLINLSKQILLRCLTIQSWGSFLWVEINCIQVSFWVIHVSFQVGLVWLLHISWSQRGPRYFDPPNNSWGACYNCGEEGHTAVNCTSAKRKKPCFVCGSFEHNAKQCTKVCDRDHFQFTWVLLSWNVRIIILDVIFLFPRYHMKFMVHRGSHCLIHNFASQFDGILSWILGIQCSHEVSRLAHKHFAV